VQPLVYARHGHVLMGWKSPVGEPPSTRLTTTIRSRQGQTREGLSEGSRPQSSKAAEHERPGRPTSPASRSIAGPFPAWITGSEGASGCATGNRGDTRAPRSGICWPSNEQAAGDHDGDQSQELVAPVQDPCHSDRDDQPVACQPRPALGPRSVDQGPRLLLKCRCVLPRREPPGADPHAGRCGGWGLETPGYPIRPFRSDQSLERILLYSSIPHRLCREKYAVTIGENQTMSSRVGRAI